MELTESSNKAYARSFAQPNSLDAMFCAIVYNKFLMDINFTNFTEDSALEVVCISHFNDVRVDSGTNDDKRRNANPGFETLKTNRSAQNLFYKFNRET